MMGRNAGWLTAATALAANKGKGPDMIYLPEVAFDMEKFLNDVDALYKKNNHVIIAVSEGIKDKDGNISRNTVHQCLRAQTLSVMHSSAD